ncbi:MAG TPA: AAA family ATPase [Myxococcota bacterium]|nr:AAA family ATPase [Myxococcota bacterium]
MRICVIRGCNLASLRGPFALDLERGALGKVGLFAITGPTGSGKSTLLDAMCLALYDRVPRLEGARGRVRGHNDTDNLTAKDVRTILRRDTAQGYAEVEFKGMDGGRYRARWSVRRARSRASGALQTATLELHDVPGRTTIFGPSDPKTKTKERIEQLVGLTYEQFRRSALLAQGDFAAFLRAPPRERAQLLERMTGTDIYAQLSVAAFERARRGRDRIETLSNQLDQLGILSETERKDLEQGAWRARQDQQEAKTRLEALEAQRNWGREQERLQAAHEDANRARVAADLAVEPPWKDELRRNLALAPLRLLRDGASRGEAALSAARARHDTARTEATESAAALAKAVALLNSARAQDQTVQAEVRGLGDELSRAHALDDRRALSERNRDQRLVDVRAATSGASEAARAAAELSRRLDEDRTELARRTATLDADRELAEQWQRIDVALGRLARARLATAGVEPHAVELAEEELAKAEAVLALATAATVALDVPGIHRRRAQLDLHEQLLRFSEQARAARVRTDETRARRTAAKGRADEARAALGDACPRREQAAKALRAAESARSLEGRRAELTDGEACPLCGATEHPWASHAPLADLVDDLRSDLRALEQRIDKARAALAAATAVVGEADREISEATRTAALANEQAIPLRKQLGAEPLSRQQIDEEEARLRHSEQLADGAQADQKRALEGQQIASRSLATAQRQARSVAGEASLGRAAQEELAGLIDDDLADPEALRVGLTTRVERWRRTQTGISALAKRIAKDELEDTKLQGAAGRAKADATREAAQARQAEDELRRLVQARSRLLGGRSTEQVETELRERTRLAETAFTGAQNQHQDAREREAAAQKGESDTNGALVDADAEACRAQRELQDALTEHGLDKSDLDSGLSMGGEEVQRHKAELEELVRRAQRAQAVLEERSRALEHHVETKPTADPDPAAEASANEAWNEAEKVRIRLQGRLDADDRDRVRGDTLRQELEDLGEQAAVWRMLSACIGSATGSRFREFAQGLTLERLVSHANRQLGDLAPRYELMRVPDEDLEIQVMDKAMGDEVRPAASLSGGETFLVSLALALGLASMSTDRKVESLFIDEGFGALDQRSLEIALATLDALQSTGRKVGVISHVHGLAQQIGVQVRVVPEAPGRSSLRMPA